MLTGCKQKNHSQNQTPNRQGYITSTYSDEHKIPYHKKKVLEGAAGIERQFDVHNSPYFPSYDFYHMKSNQHLTLLEKFKTIQQTTEVTCGPTCALMILEHFNLLDGKNDHDLAALRNTTRDTTYLRDIIRILNTIGGLQYESTYNYADDPSSISGNLLLNYLKRGIPVIIGTNEWNGHWQVIIGYDTMGTDNTADDILILAEPYDTTDHNQDGYVIYPFERLFYGSWHTTFDPDFKWGLFVAAWKKS